MEEQTPPPQTDQPKKVEEDATAVPQQQEETAPQNDDAQPKEANQALDLAVNKAIAQDQVPPTTETQRFEEYKTELEPEAAGASGTAPQNPVIEENKNDNPAQETQEEAQKVELQVEAVDEANYQTNRPEADQAKDEKAPEASAAAATESDPTISVLRSATLGAAGEQNQSVGVQKLDSLGLNNAQEMSRSSSLKLGEATPAFDRSNTEQMLANAEKRAMDDLEQSKRQAIAMGQIPEAEEQDETHKKDQELVQVETTATFAAVAQQQKADDVEEQQTQMMREIERDVTGHQIDIDVDSMEEYETVTAIKINRDLYLRLLQTGVISEQEAGTTYLDFKGQPSEETTLELTKRLSCKYMNGVVFSKYLVFLKKHMKLTYNQIWSFKVATLHETKSGADQLTVAENWNIINAELDKISITISEENLTAITQGKQEPVDKMFSRIERYSKMITFPGFLKFEEMAEEDKYNDEMDDTVYHQALTDENLSELISLRQHTMRSNVSKPNLTKRMITRGETKLSNRFIMPPGVNNPPPKKGLTMLDNGLGMRKEGSDLNKSIVSPAYIKVDKDYPMEISEQKTDSLKQSFNANDVSPQPKNEKLDIDVTADNDVIQGAITPALQEEERVAETKPEKKVKDGVDILALEADMNVENCDSSLELILVTLSKAFQMSPKQAAALLTNNNQYLITACIKGVKGGRYEPLLNWYDLLISNCATLANLLHLENKQLPQSARQTFIKVMAAIGCGFFSYNIELVYMSFTLFTQLFEQFKEEKSEKTHEQALKWFLSQGPVIDEIAAAEETTAEQLISDKSQQPASQQQELINAGGLKLSLYAISKHREATRHAIILYSVLCDADDQYYQIYTVEIQNHTKSILEYMELVGEFLPVMGEMWPERAIESGLVDFWLDLCSREAENDFKVQNREKVLAISLLTEIWLLFTDYVDDKDEVTNTLIFVFKRTLSERTKTIRLLSIAYLFKVLEKLITMKKKAALTLYRALIFSLVETPYDPTIRELFMTNFGDLFSQNQKMPIEWLVEPLLKQVQAQLGVTYVLKIFDFTFMMAMLNHPKFKDEHATQMFSLFAQVSLDDTSYAMVSHDIMMTTLAKFLPARGVEIGLMDKLQSHVLLIFDQLLDLEPISKAAALTQMKRQQRQQALKMRQGGGTLGQHKSSQLSLLQNTPGGSNSGAKPPLKARELLGSKTANVSAVSLGSSTKVNYQKDMQRRLKKSLIITFLLKVQGLNLDVPFLKDLLFEKTREFKATYGYFNKGHLALLQAYGDPESLILENELDPQLMEQQKLEQQINREATNSYAVGQRNTSVKNSPYQKLNGSTKLRNIIRTPSRATSQRDSDYRLNTGDTKNGVVALYNLKEDDRDNESRQVVPYQEGSSSNNNIRSKSIGRARALQEIEKIRKQKKDRDLKKNAEFEKQRQQSEKRKKRAKQDVEKIKQKLGVADRASSKLPALMYGGGQAQQEVGRHGFRPKPVIFVNIEEEEDRDKESISEFMRKYQKLWRNIFAKYLDTGHKAKAFSKISFDQQKSQALNFAEITKLLKDHGMYPQLLNKDELSSMVRQVNLKADEPRSDIAALNYSGYQTFLIQLATHCYSRPPQDLSSQPMVNSLEALVATFCEATKKRNLSTLLYEDPDAVTAMSQKDRNTIKDLNEKLKTQPDLPMPEGFLRVKEKVPITSYNVPSVALPVIGEAKAVCVELVDELMNKIFNFHVLEPIVTIQEQYRAKPSMQRSLQKLKGAERGDRAEALSIIRRAEENAERPSRNTNRSNLPKIGQSRPQKATLSVDDLPQVYGKIVSQQPKAKRAVYEECSFVLENIVRKVLGEGELKPHEEVSYPDTFSSSQEGKRLSLPPGGLSHKNMVKLLPPLDAFDEQEDQKIKYDIFKKQQDKANLLEKRQKEKRRQERQKKLKADLEQLKADKAQKEEEEINQKKVDAKKAKIAAKKLEERRQQLRDERIQEITTRKEEEKEGPGATQLEADAEDEAERQKEKAREKKEFFRRQQEKLNNQFKSMTDQRKASNLQEQQKAIKDKQNRQVLQNRIAQQNKQGQGNRERQLAADLATFIQRPEVRQLFSDHDKSLLKYFKFYCKQNRVELGQDLQFRLEHLDFTSFNKLGLQSKIVPVLISSEQLKHSFRNTLKYQANNADLASVSNSEQPSGRDGPESSSQVQSRAPSVIGETNGQTLDFDQFKKALVRVAIQGQELLGGQSEEQKQKKAQLDEKRKHAEQRKKELLKNRQEQRAKLESETLAEMKQEYTQKQKQIQSAISRSPAKKLVKVQSEEALSSAQDHNVTINEEDLQRWLKQQDAIGNGLAQRVAEKLNNASKPRPTAAADADQQQQDTPGKLHNQIDVAESQEEIGTENGAPLLRAKQSKAQSLQQEAGVDAELDIAFISSDTVKGLFEFMKLEAGDEGEKKVDLLLAAQSSGQAIRGRAAGQAGRGVSKEPVLAAATTAPVQEHQ